ncbi:unnamed protein product [Ambrosiozyma monospora]|uniref:Unnamed protein product n=1 Tax=Ambrosiozyma monospora TaxID=43982 RepID=A0ACB5UBP6_AMBMO|nr:unnamed protein product [Ambrosiozyma monospora]
MLKREHEMGLIGANNSDITDELKKEYMSNSEDEGFFNPLWREYKFPKNKLKNKAYANVIQKQPSHFYFNLYSGACSFTKPIIKSDCMGGILADEMGLVGK